MGAHTLVSRPARTERARGTWRVVRSSIALMLLPLLVACVGEKQEQRLGDEMAREINTRVPLVRDPVLNLYLNRLGMRLASVSERPKLPFRFYIVNSPEINAFAIPGGHIYVTRGLIQETEDLSQLSAVLAHEIGHTAARHGAEQLQRQLRTGSLVSILYDVILGREPTLLDQQALQIGTRYWYARHSREDELDADRRAVRYLLSAGVEPTGIVAFLERLMHQERGTDDALSRWFSSHPVTGDRIADLERRIGREERKEHAPLITNVDSYADFLRRLERTGGSRAQ